MFDDFIKIEEVGAVLKTRYINRKYIRKIVTYPADKKIYIYYNGLSSGDFAEIKLATTEAFNALESRIVNGKP